MTDVALVPATVAHLAALRSAPAAFGAMIDSPIPAGWPEFPESIEYTLARLTDHPDQADWWMHFFLAGGVLVGSGGFAGPPADGAVEIGYQIAPAFRGRGLAAAAAAAMIAKAVAAGTVNTVVAHTLANENPSTGVLRRLGFRWAGERTDPDEGTVWRFELPARRIPPATGRL